MTTWQLNGYIVKGEPALIFDQTLCAATWCQGESHGGRQQLGSQVMVQSEKLMVCQAAKTAEMFDSEKEIEDAAKMVASLIQKSSHCTAFTGKQSCLFC